MTLGQVPWFQNHGLSALTLAIVLGMVLGNTVYSAWGATCGPGVTLSKQKLLRLGIVLYGLRLTMSDIVNVGWSGALIDVLVLGSTYALACWLGIGVLRMDRKTAMLIGAGSSICGAAAVMATEPVLRARSEQVTVAVATVVVFGTVGIFLYPALYAFSQSAGLIPGGASGYGVFMGSTIHEVAQVVAAARSVGPEAADAAVISKMVRVMMLAPFLLGLSLWLAREKAEHEPHHDAAQASGWLARLSIPWFAFAFIGVVVLGSIWPLSEPAKATALNVDTVLLAMAMAALGLSTHLTAIRQAGAKPLLLALALFVWLVAGGALINHLVQVCLA
jgi:uncharacterized integral membrane protein (TIGR00698 family)